jgi:hypothetical protein
MAWFADLSPCNYFGPEPCFGPTHEWHVDIEFTPFAIKLDNLNHHQGFQVCLG